jgi:hypothetical protein
VNLAEVHRFVEVWERAWYMGPAEAAAWRERIAIWRRFGRQGQAMKPVAEPLLDDPDPYLSSSCAEPPDSQRRQLQPPAPKWTRASRIEVLGLRSIPATAASASDWSLPLWAVPGIVSKQAFQRGGRVSRV